MPNSSLVLCAVISTVYFVLIWNMLVILKSREKEVDTITYYA